MNTDGQTIIALAIVVVVLGRFIYNWLQKRKRKKLSGGCGCDNDGCD